MDEKRFLIVTLVLFGVIATLHLVRLVLGWPVSIAEVAIPLWVSVFGVLVPGALAAWALALLRRRAG